MGERTVFQENISDNLEDNQAVMERLAVDWTVSLQAGRLSVPRALDGYEDEVIRRLGHGFGLDNYSLVDAQIRKIRELPEENPVRRYLVTPSRSRNDTLREWAESHNSYLADAVTYVHLLGSVRKSTGTDRAQRSVEAIYALNVDQEMQQALHRGIDFWIYKEARHAPQFAKGFGVTDLASSGEARSAMRGALDRRVLKYAMRDKEPPRKLGQEIINQFASSDDAREAMLGHIALLTEGQRGHSTGWYEQRASEQFIQRLLLDRLRKQSEKMREETAERMREHREWFRKFKEDMRDNFDDNTYRDIFNEEPGPRPKPSAEGPVEKRLTVAIDRAHHTVRGTLRRMDQGLLTGIIQKVDTLRTETPEIGDIKVIAHFHHRGQLEGAAKDDVDAAKAIHLFATVDKGEKTALSF